MKWFVSFAALLLSTTLLFNCTTPPPCSPACGAGEICLEGRCRPNCRYQDTVCDNRCVNLRSDREHCGVCDNPCPSDSQCIVGQCVQVCAQGQQLCGGECTDTTVSPAHCGRCGNACTLGQACEGGTCKDRCLDGQILCEGYCYDANTSVLHCGRCGNTCPKEFSCVNRKCVKVGCGSNRDCKEGEVCLQGSCLRLPTGRQEGEECKPGQTTGSELCAPGLTCFALKEDRSRGLCFRRCEQNEKICTEGKVCSPVSSYKLCLRQVEEGEACDVRKLTTCKTGLVCDESSKRCKRSNAPPPFPACGADNLPACKEGDVCAKLSGQQNTGYCVKTCDPATSSCGEKRFCQPLQSGDVKGVCLYRCSNSTDCPVGWSCQTRPNQTSYCRP